MKKLSLITLLIATILIGCKDKCADVSCLNDGVCNDGTCTCPTGYEGEFCQDEARTKFLGTYNVTETTVSGLDGTTSTPINYVCQIIANGSDKYAIKFTNLHDYGVETTATISSNAISIPSQPFSPSIVTLSIGNGSLSGTTISLTYEWNFNYPNPNVSTATFTKQ